METASYEKIGTSEQAEYACSLRWEPLNSDFRINAFGIHEVMPPVKIHRPEGTGDWLIMLFYDAAQVAWLDGTKMIPPGSLVFWEHGASHCYGTESQVWDHSWIHVDGSWVTDRLMECGIQAPCVLRPTQPELLVDVLWQLYAELTGHRNPDPVILKNIFHNWLRGLARDIRGEILPFIPEKIRSVKQCLDQHACRPITLQALAEKSGMSIPHLCSEFRRHYGDSPVNYLLGQRLAQARCLLLNRELSIAEIAAKVGYHDPCYFSKQFKNRFGESPRSMRGG